MYIFSRVCRGKTFSYSLMQTPRSSRPPILLTLLFDSAGSHQAARSPTWLLVSLRRARPSCRTWWEVERWRSASAEIKSALVCQSGKVNRCPGFTLSVAISLNG